MSIYPGAQDTFRVTTNLAGITYDAADTKTVYAEDTNNLNNAVVAIESTLGINPQGGSATVVSRLNTLDTTVSGKQAALGFTAENVANKSTTTTLGTSDTLYPSQKAAKTYVDTGLATKENSIGYTTENVANKSTSTSLGASNTLYPSQNAVKSYVDTGLAGKQASLGFTAENVANKSTTTTLGTSDTLYPSQKAAKTYVDNSIFREIARATVTSGTSTTLDSGTIAAYKYLKITLVMHSGGTTLEPYGRFNSDSGNNYSYRTSENGGADAGATNVSGIQTGSNTLAGFHGEYFIVNEAAYHKVAHGIISWWDTSTNIYRNTYAAKWQNTSAQITQVTWVATTGAFRPGSELIVYGRN